MLEPNACTPLVMMLDLSTAQLQKGQTLWVRAFQGVVPEFHGYPYSQHDMFQISRICLELGDRHSKMFGQLEFNLDSPPNTSSIRIKPELGSSALR